MGVGELVLSSSGVSWNHFYNAELGLTEKDSLTVAADLISQVTLLFDPEDPINSLLHTAANTVSCSAADLRYAVGSNNSSTLFSGNALVSFFQDSSTPERPYIRYVLGRFYGRSEKDIDQLFSDEDLAASLLKRLKIRSKELSNGTGLFPLCCTPSRTNKGLLFWINTGSFTQIDGWKTQEELEIWITSGTQLVRNPPGREL